MTSHSFFSSHPSTLLNLQPSKSQNPISRTSLNTNQFSRTSLNNTNPFSRTSLNSVKTKSFGAIKLSATDSSSATVVDNPQSDQSNDGAKIGAKVKVKVPLKVYHIPKVAEFELEGKIGTLKQYVAFHKGKPISANYPFKVEFVEDGIEGRDGPVKFSTHLREDEFDYVN